MTTPQQAPPVTQARSQAFIDVRGPRFSSAVTAGLLGTALVLQGNVGVVLVAIQVVAFAIAVAGGVTRSPWAVLFRFLRDRLDWGPATEFEDAAPPRFSQLCGLVVAGTGLLLLLVGVPVAGWIAVGVVFALAALLAVTGLCVGCELYLLGMRLRRVRA